MRDHPSMSLVADIGRRIVIRDSRRELRERPMSRSRMILAFTMLCAILHGGCGKSTSTVRSPEPEARGTPVTVAKWPALPTSGFVAGRVATENDVTNGNALFAAFGTVTSDVMRIDIPQYALLREDSGETVRVFVVQAEVVHGEDGDVEMYGLRPVEGGEPVAAAAHEVTLLGTHAPPE